MCPMEKRDLMTGQISFYPLGSEDFLDEIEEVLSLIRASGLDYEINSLSTNFKGKPGQVLDLLARIHQEMTAAGCQYSMQVLLSNTCGC